MGIFDVFSSAPDKKALKLKAKVVQKYGDAATRQKAIEEVAKLKVPEALAVLLQRFTFSVDPHTTDANEKDRVFSIITELGQDAVGPVKDFLAKTDLASSWAMRILSAILPEPDVVGIATDLLRQLGAAYTRNPEKKIVLLQFLEGKDDPRIAGVLLPLLDDMADDVKLAVLKVMGPLKHEPARESILNLLVAEETARRVRTACIQALFESEFGVQGYREKVEAHMQDPYFVDKAGLVKKRG